MGIVAGVVQALTEAGITDDGMTGVCADRRWLTPGPGESVIVVTAPSTWTASPTTADFPEIRVEIYSAPTADQEDAEQVGEPVAAEVRRVLHLTDGYVRTWADIRVIRSGLVGWALLPVEGHESWRLRLLTFEMQTA